jgi:hypothetical protein
MYSTYVLDCLCSNSIASVCCAKKFRKDFRNIVNITNNLEKFRHMVFGTTKVIYTVM